MSTRARAAAALALLLALLALPGAPAFAQCAMCKTALTGSSEGRHMAHQLNLAILMMVFAPYVITAVVGSVLFRRQLAGLLSPLRARLLRRHS